MHKRAKLLLVTTTTIFVIALLSGCDSNRPALTQEAAAAPPASGATSQPATSTPAATTGGAPKLVDGPEAKKLVGDGAFLLDVRSVGEFNGGHINGAVNIPVNSLGRQLAKLPQDKSKPIVVYCLSGARSSYAAKLLVGAGYTQVFDLGAQRKWN